RVSWNVADDGKENSLARSYRISVSLIRRVGFCFKWIADLAGDLVFYQGAVADTEIKLTTPQFARLLDHHLAGAKTCEHVLLEFRFLKIGAGAPLTTLIRGANKGSQTGQRSGDSDFVIVRDTLRQERSNLFNNF